ncbi:MAG: hypothetical protein ACREXU_04445 [Gammaproteobacteria bacterium]
MFHGEVLQHALTDEDHLDMAVVGGELFLWLRTVRPGIPPPELVTAAAARNALPEFLADPDYCPIFKKFLRDRLDPTRYEPLRLAG